MHSPPAKPSSQSPTSFEFSARRRLLAKAEWESWGCLFLAAWEHDHQLVGAAPRGLSEAGSLGHL